MNPILKALLGPAAKEAEKLSLNRYLHRARHQKAAQLLIEFEKTHASELNEASDAKNRLSDKRKDLELETTRLEASRMQLLPILGEKVSLWGQLQLLFESVVSRFLPALINPSQVDLRTSSEILRAIEEITNKLDATHKALEELREDEISHRNKTAKLELEGTSLSRRLAYETRSESEAVEAMQSMVINRISNTPIGVLAASLSACDSCCQSVLNGILQIRLERTAINFESLESETGPPLIKTTDNLSGSIRLGESNKGFPSSTQVQMSGTIERNGRQSRAMSDAMVNNFMQIASWNPSPLASAMAATCCGEFRKGASEQALKHQSISPEMQDDLDELMRLTGLQDDSISTEEF